MMMLSDPLLHIRATICPLLRCCSPEVLPLPRRCSCVRPCVVIADDEE